MKNEEDLNNERRGQRWFIDFTWYQQNNRSPLTLIKHCLCHKCQEQFGAGEPEVSITDIIANIKDCCCQDSNFITGRLPILEGVFRLILANGNQPLDLEEIGSRLRERLGGDTYRTSPELLSRLLENDRHYGLRQVT